MKVSVNYHEILEESLIEELEWLKEEFIILFKSKVQKYTNRDKSTANSILDYVMNNMYVNDSMILLTLFTEAIENIERMYPNLF
ncbi:MAG: hypothetical protein KGD58_05475 [Candidatus Lokiarchaeota archaeon]|nr:hypothetical protein [Candidatus Lokiarchaeota archaeon]